MPLDHAICAVVPDDRSHFLIGKNMAAGRQGACGKDGCGDDQQHERERATGA
jgi:hypothetical protein